MDSVKKMILEFDDPEKLTVKAAGYFKQIALASIQDHGYFTVALSGGSSPKPFYKYLTRQEYSGSFPWDKTYLFWGDERVVPQEHPESNYWMAFQAFLSKVNVPPSNVFKMIMDMSPVEKAAGQYEKRLKYIFMHLNSIHPVKKTPVFDLVILGIGKDGHTASLFPGSPALEENEKWVVGVKAENNTISERITLTLPVINSARHVLFIVSGTGKGAVLNGLLKTDIEKLQFPASLVKPDGQTVWLVDMNSY